MWNSCVAVKAVSGDVVAGGEKQTRGPRKQKVLLGQSDLEQGVVVVEEVIVGTQL